MLSFPNDIVSLIFTAGIVSKTADFPTIMISCQKSSLANFRCKKSCEQSWCNRSGYFGVFTIDRITKDGKQFSNGNIVSQKIFFIRYILSIISSTCGFALILWICNKFPPSIFFFVFERNSFLEDFFYGCILRPPPLPLPP